MDFNTEMNPESYNPRELLKFIWKEQKEQTQLIREQGQKIDDLNIWKVKIQTKISLLAFLFTSGAVMAIVGFFWKYLVG